MPPDNLFGAWRVSDCRGSTVAQSTPHGMWPTVENWHQCDQACRGGHVEVKMKGIVWRDQENYQQPQKENNGSMTTRNNSIVDSFPFWNIRNRCNINKVRHFPVPATMDGQIFNFIFTSAAIKTPTNSLLPANGEKKLQTSQEHFSHEALYTDDYRCYRQDV